ncbi:DUF1799 domain-containing protein [Pseudoalteromonas sp. JBTF-M23]|uniref:DUF1799 domain-containing protein n=1 Tax=Pseudoalteromonas caenipelagi TaxID=2726988 RepID=A0A849V9J1_9GAMM|nr:DUF1799 domain-containing protein [Pseudoalteromonas caenipelagi]NOU50269.1 DUF1799 domain-containing protein [Pseudoalteromonas caenipelagi]
MGDLAASKTVDDDLAHFCGPITKPKTQNELYVLPQNWPAVNALTLASSQWQYCKEGVEIGLDYARAEIAWRYAELKLTPSDFNKLQFLERSIITIQRQGDEQRLESSVTLEVRR